MEFVESILCEFQPALRVVGLFRILKEKPAKESESASADTGKRSRIVSKYPSHIRHTDLTAVPISGGFWTNWVPNAIWQRWPICVWLLNVVDHYSRRSMGGVDRPTVERADADFDTLGILFRGYIDFGVREQDHRGAFKMKGEARAAQLWLEIARGRSCTGNGAYLDETIRLHATTMMGAEILCYARTRPTVNLSA